MRVTLQRTRQSLFSKVFFVHRHFNCWSVNVVSQPVSLFSIHSFPHSAMGTRKFSLVWESSWLWTSSWSEATLISLCLFPCGGRSSPGQMFPSQVRKMGIHVCLNVFYFLLCHIKLPTFVNLIQGVVVLYSLLWYFFFVILEMRTYILEYLCVVDINSTLKNILYI